MAPRGALIGPVARVRPWRTIKERRREPSERGVRTGTGDRRAPGEEWVTMRVHVGNTRVRASWLGAIVGTIGGLAYSSFLLEGFFRTGLNPLHSYVSESSVAGRPYAFLFRTGDIAAGCGLLVLAVALARRLPARRPRAGGCLALAVTAAASITDGVWPMPWPRPSTRSAVRRTAPTWASSSARSTLCRA
ncbi:DUF998 domain-containing protein [Streptomyces sp. NPDC055966]|uniref:DUF998 domain-containing protein n=1 Tax=Streptomyces sp. NPDC055966 TaxID=3345669 RepID=UPI0035D9743D